MHGSHTSLIKTEKRSYIITFIKQHIFKFACHYLLMCLVYLTNQAFVITHAGMHVCTHARHTHAHTDMSEEGGMSEYKPSH